MSSFPWFRFTAVSAGLMGIGYALMKTTVPTEEETYNAMAPDLRRKVDAARAARLAREDAMKRQVAAQLQPITSDSDPDGTKPIWADARQK